MKGIAIMGWRWTAGRSRMEGHPRYLKEGFEPYDPIQLAHLTEDMICRDLARKYTDFYCTGI